MVGKNAEKSWKYYLEGLWWSGLLLSESLEVYWDRPDKLCVDFSGKRPMLRIPAKLENGHQDRLLPMAPEFAEFLEATPYPLRHDRVFKLRGLDSTRPQGGGPRADEIACSERAGKVVSKIGKKAGVVVDVKPIPRWLQKEDGPTQKIKYASAHDLRRSFGERWSSRVMPPVSKELMRHESIETPMLF